MKIYLVILSVLAVFSMLIISSDAIPTCTFRSGSCSGGEYCIFKTVQENNTHIGSCDASYPTIVCCTELASNAAIRSSCNADEGGIISIYATTNAHAGRRDHYSNIVCAKTSSNPIVTNIRSTDCLAREKCVASVFQNNNTHVGRCGYYSYNVCIQELLNVTLTVVLNNTEPNWNEGVKVEGNASRSDGTAVDTSQDPENVKAYVNGSLSCTTDTNSTGGYNCSFNAPSAVGLYELNVTIEDPTTSKIWWNTTTFTVKQVVLGEALPIQESAESVACYEEPRLVQNPDGTIEIAIVRICIFK